MSNIGYRKILGRLCLRASVEQAVLGGKPIFQFDTCDLAKLLTITLGSHSKSAERSLKRYWLAVSR